MSQTDLTANKLTAKKCTPCQGGIPPLSCDIATQYLSDAPGWELRKTLRASNAPSNSKTFWTRWLLRKKSACYVKKKAIIRISLWAGAIARLFSRRIKSTACMKTTSSWPPRLTSWQKPTTESTGACHEQGNRRIRRSHCRI